MESANRDFESTGEAGTPADIGGISHFLCFLFQIFQNAL